MMIWIFLLLIVACLILLLVIGFAKTSNPDLSAPSTLPVFQEQEVIIQTKCTEPEKLMPLPAARKVYRRVYTEDTVTIQSPAMILPLEKTTQGKSIYLDPTARVHWFLRPIPFQSFRWSSLDEVNNALENFFQNRKTKYDYQVQPWSVRSIVLPPDLGNPITFSIIMPIFNQAQHIKEVLDSILACMDTKEQESFEFIFLVDGCTDESENIVSEWIQTSASHIPSLCIRIPPFESIFETACDNLGASLSSGAFLLEIQADLIIQEKGFASHLLQPLLSYQDLIAVSGRCCHNSLASDGIGFLQLPTECGTPVNQNNNICYLMSTVNRGPLLMDKEKWTQMDGFDEVHYVLGDDDHDLFHRAYTTCGYRCAFVPMQFVCYPNHGSTRQPRSQIQQNILDVRSNHLPYPRRSQDDFFSLAMFRPLQTSWASIWHPISVSSILSTSVPIILISFANTKSAFFQNAELAMEAHRLNNICFSGVFLYNEFDIQSFIPLLPLDAKNKRGWYYWSWKPWIVLETMAKVPPNSILVYADAGLFFHNPISFYSIIEKVIQTDESLFFSTNHGIFPFCKCEAWPAFEEAISKLETASMADAACFFLKNTTLNQSLMQEWLQLCCKPFYLSDIRTGTCKNIPEFDDHRHDQSLLTAVLRNHGISYAHSLLEIAHHHKSRSSEQVQHLRQDLYAQHVPAF